MVSGAGQGGAELAKVPQGCLWASGSGRWDFLGGLPSRTNEPLPLSTQPARQLSYGLYPDFT